MSLTTVLKFPNHSWIPRNTYFDYNDSHSSLLEQFDSPVVGFENSLKSNFKTQGRPRHGQELSTKPYLDCENYYLTNLSIAVRSGPMRTWDYELSLLEFESMLDELMMARTTVRVALVLVERVAMLVAQFLKEKIWVISYESYYGK